MKLALFDIDGVLADDRHRVHHALARHWFKYFDRSLVAADSAWPEGVAAVRDFEEQGWTIGYLTGRREDLRDVTTKWLKRHGFPVGPLLMRPFTGSGIPLALFKLDRIEKLYSADALRPDDQIILLDDDPEVIRVVGEKFGAGSVVHCTWHIKEKALIKTATA